MTEMNPALRAEFDDFLENDIEVCMQPLDRENVEELIWQGFLFGLRAFNRYPQPFVAKCCECPSSLSQTADGEIIWMHDVAKNEGWRWNFDDQNWTCPDCLT